MYWFETHAHTIPGSPCAKVSAKDTILAYHSRGYSGIVITNHYHPHIFDQVWEGLSFAEKQERQLQGYREAKACGDACGLSVLLGMEINFRGDPNDYLVYGIDEHFILDNGDFTELGLERFKKEVVDQDARILLVQAHPNRPHCRPADPALLHGYEVYNGNMRHDSHNDETLALAKQNQKLMLSGSDFHQPEDLARGGISLPTCPRDSFAFAEAVRKGGYTLITT